MSEHLPKILIVDDVQSNHIAIEAMVKGLKLATVHANSGEEALRILVNEHNFAVILLDVQMPVIDGYEVADLIRGNEETKNIPIIFLTAMNKSSQNESKAYQSGAVDFIYKPINETIILHKIKIFLELHALNQSLIEEKRRADVANAQKTKFVQIMTHDIRAPLGAILGFTELVLEDTPPDATTKNDLRKIQAAAHLLMTLTDDVLDLGKISEEKLNLHLTKFSPDMIIEKLSGIAEILATKRSNHYSLRSGLPEDFTVYADQKKLERIFCNLVSNSAKFTSHGEITATLEETSINERPALKMSVHDTGIGMTSVQLQKVFDRFTQAEESTNLDYGGSGLGLSIVKQFTEGQGGKVEVASEEGGGTTFSIYIPQHVKDEDSEPPSNLKLIA